MPVHDWTRIDAGTFHAFHTAWVTHLMEALNGGLLPPPYYALAEQVASQRQTDVLTLQVGPTPAGVPPGGLAVAEAAPSVRVRARLEPESARRPAIRRSRRVVVRHVSGHRVVAVVEIASPANKDRRGSVNNLAGKVVQLLQAGIHVLLIDLLPPGRFDPGGIHGAVCKLFGAAGYQPPPGEAFTLASYRADGAEPEVFLEPVGLGRPLIDMPLFLSRERYVNVPLEKTYLQAYERFPAFWKHVLEGAATDGS
jgi:hypothetical protein